MSDVMLIDTFISGKLQAADKLLFEARLLVDPQLREDLQWQKLVHQLVKQHGRDNLKAELESVRRDLFSQPKYGEFKKQIENIFSSTP